LVGGNASACVQSIASKEFHSKSVLPERQESLKTMWLTAPNRIGIAAWQVDDAVWRVEARGGRDGIRIALGAESFSVWASDDRPLPRLEEQFVRAEELHLHYPQTGRFEFGFRLVLRPILEGPIKTDANQIVMEMLVSVQTDLLDSTPTLDLRLPCSAAMETRRIEAVDQAAIIASSTDCQSVVLLGPHDAPFTSVAEQAGTVRVRLFNDFLEKGVIRRARPWLVFRRDGNPLAGAKLDAIWKTLAGSPLPLT
jgi:hypothetical protein